jgi:hypothetical protein
MYTCARFFKWMDLSASSQQRIRAYTHVHTHTHETYEFHRLSISTVTERRIVRLTAWFLQILAFVRIVTAMYIHTFLYTHTYKNLRI